MAQSTGKTTGKSIVTCPLGCKSGSFATAQSSTTLATGADFSVQDTTVTAGQISGNVGLSIGHDTIQSAAEVPLGTTLNQINAVAGYVQNDTISGPTQANAVALYGLATAAVNSANVWGINTVLEDGTTQKTGTGTGRIIQNEFDYVVWNSGTSVYGLSLIANLQAQPLNSTGVAVSTVSGPNKWGTAFYSANGAAVAGLTLGALGFPAPTTPSQFMDFVYFDSSNTAQNINLQALADGTLTLAGSAAANLHLMNGYVSAAGGLITGNSGALVTSTVSLANAAGSAIATLKNAPVSGNPTKWIQINDNGTIRRIPTW